MGLRADPGAPRRAHHRQGARRRHADRRLHHRGRRPARCSSPATTARPSPAARSPPRRRLPCSTIVDDPALLRRVRELGAHAARGAARARRRPRGPRPRPDARRRPRGGDRRRRARRRPAATAGLVVNVPEPGTLRLLPPLVVDPDQVERAVGLIGESLLGLSAIVKPLDRPSCLQPACRKHHRAAGRDRRGRRAGRLEGHRRRRGAGPAAAGRSGGRGGSARRRAPRLAGGAGRLPGRPVGGDQERVRASARLPGRGKGADSRRRRGSPRLGAEGERPWRGSHLTAVAPVEEEPPLGAGLFEPERSTSAGARLLATQMAVSGSSREEIEARLRSGFEIEDTDSILDAILGPED